MCIRDRYYTLSQQRIPYMRDKTKDDRFFILTLFGIGMELELEGQRPRNEITKVNLPVGLPPAHYGSLDVYRRQHMGIARWR